MVDHRDAVRGDHWDVRDDDHLVDQDDLHQSEAMLVTFVAFVMVY